MMRMTGSHHSLICFLRQSHETVVETDSKLPLTNVSLNNNTYIDTNIQPRSSTGAKPTLIPSPTFTQSLQQNNSNRSYLLRQTSAPATVQTQVISSSFSDMRGSVPPSVPVNSIQMTSAPLTLRSMAEGDSQRYPSQPEPIEIVEMDKNNASGDIGSQVCVVVIFII